MAPPCPLKLPGPVSLSRPPQDEEVPPLFASKVCNPQNPNYRIRQGPGERLHDLQLRKHEFPPHVEDRLPLTSSQCLDCTKPFYNYYFGAPADYRDPPPTSFPPCWSWSKQQVADWLVDVGYGRYRDMFIKLNIDGQRLAKIDAQDLRRMGVKLWTDCIGLVSAAKEFTGRRILLNPDNFRNKIYPYHVGLYCGEDNCLPSPNQVFKNPLFDPDPSKDQIYRYIYRTAGDRFFFFDSSKQQNLI
ncbi:unnamed protein product [Lymnaea stagnalis]|uniref:SAM domain-containing protein n=1 Tax=Lymnaea stagnalis TaxID=6523 RepID=A0AAV2INE6_LYMST